MRKDPKPAASALNLCFPFDIGKRATAKLLELNIFSPFFGFSMLM